jgi:hypothetical protein
MGFAAESQSVYPIVNSDLSDIIGAPGLPPWCGRLRVAVSGHIAPE